MPMPLRRLPARPRATMAADRRSASLRVFLSCDRLEVAVDLLFVFRRRVVVGAGRQAILRLFGLKLFRQGCFGLLERLRRLPAEVFPLCEVLLEGFRARRGEHTARTLEGGAPSPACEAGIVAAQLIDELLGFLQAALILLA